MLYCFLHPHRPVTTDVQDSTAVVTPNSVMIRCHFLLGSQSKGCHVRLIFGTSTLIVRNIKRRTGSHSVEEKIIIAGGIQRQLELDFTVFDWEKDGSIGNLPTRVNITMAYGQGRLYSTVNSYHCHKFEFCKHYD